MKSWKIDVPVLLIFFARPKEFEKTFEQVRKARPSTLLLWQDGPREGRQDDIENIRRCREIAENIDWECTVYKNYHETNMGCDPSTHYAHKWAFSLVDKCIILEDDLVVSQSLFPFCKELLDRYEHDERIDRICCLNQLGRYDNGYSYLFNWNGASTGWATWKRVADTWETEYDCIDNNYFCRLGKLKVNSKSHETFLKVCRQHKEEKIPHWEDIVANAMLMNSRLVIVPTVNMVHNVGADSENSTHGAESFDELPKVLRELFNLVNYEMEMPIKHPPYMVEDQEYAQAVQKKFFPQSKVKKFFRKIETLWYRVRKGNFKKIGESIKRRFGKGKKK